MNNNNQSLFVQNLFTGEEWLRMVEVELRGNRVQNIQPAAVQFGANWIPVLAPAFIDLQLYGAEGRLLSVYPDAATIHAIRRTCEAGGATHFQPTVATNSTEVFKSCIEAVRSYWKEGGEGCLGLHVEGPWIHPAKKGAHLEEFIVRGTLARVSELLELGKGVISMITLAPECCEMGVIEMIQSSGVVISAGHSNATYAESMAAFDRGIPVATHLYNAMSPLQHRAPGLVGAVLDHGSAMASIIPDGHHVDFAAIRIAKKIMGNRLLMITDAVTDTEGGPYRHQRVGDKYESSGILSGSMINMVEGVRNLIQQVGIEEGEALRMAALYPALLMNRVGVSGKIEEGELLNGVMLDENWNVLDVFRAH
jgi:N-acetylglucosamine-6-phosphate deacetylase